MVSPAFQGLKVAVRRVFDASATSRRKSFGNPSLLHGLTPVFIVNDGNLTEFLRFMPSLDDRRTARSDVKIVPWAMEKMTGSCCT